MRKQYYCEEFPPVPFIEGTLLAPVLLLFILYTPTIIYLIKKSYDKFGKKNFFESFFDNIVIFIFPLATNISFYDYNVISRTRQTLKRYNGIKNETIDQNKKYIRRTKSLESFSKPSEEIEKIKRKSSSCHLLTGGNDGTYKILHLYFAPRFSLHQSNVLYFFFFSAAFMILFIEVYIQVSRGFDSSFTDWLRNPGWGIITKIFSSILFFNLLLWLDFNREFRKDQTESRKLFSIKAVIIKILQWMSICPFICCYAYLR